MPTVEVYEADKKRIQSLRKENPPERERRYESNAKVIRGLLDAAGIPYVDKNPGDGSP